MLDLEPTLSDRLISNLKKEIRIMIYKPFEDIKLSALGMGCMRLPVIGGNYAEVDEAATSQMVDWAFSHGVNYFDTAYGYHEGNSELALGKALKKYPREQFYLADKFPGYDLSNMDKVEQIFEEQLERCGVEYFDFYLFHNVYEKNIEPYKDPKFGIMDYLLKQKENGRIKHLGFSCHWQFPILKDFIDTYGDKMEFCQIQLNWLDWDFQDAKAKVELLNSLNIPIWVMEPLRGGKLSNLAEKDMAKLKALRPDETATNWAFHFLQSVSGVTVTLSGMSDLEQVKQNIETFSSEKPLNENELEALDKIAKGMLENNILPCTACRYCTSHCPRHLDIPTLLALYNEHTFTGGGFIAPMAVDAMPPEKRPSACIGCRSCEAVCPQQIKISQAMSAFAKMVG